LSVPRWYSWIDLKQKRHTFFSTYLEVRDKEDRLGTDSDIVGRIDKSILVVAPEMHFYFLISFFYAICQHGFEFLWHDKIQVVLMS
jgi:hypothetical protein